MPVLGHQFRKQDRLASKQEIYDLAFPLISHVLRHFGNYRVIFAFNFPMDRVINSSLLNIINAFSDVVVGSMNALKQVFYHNAKQFYRL